jgi:hypothetical protein
MWPKLTNINPNIAAKVKSYADSLETSKLNAWIRVFSGAVVGSNSGLVMESNTDSKLFRAAGETSRVIYGDRQSSGILGVDWYGQAVETDVGRRLRPSPIITSFSVKEGKDQISRHATLEIKAFSLEQMEKMQSYFLEPGYSLYIEWGWNTGDGVRNITKVGESSAGGLVTSIANKSLSWTKLSETRLNSNGEFDCFLGFIVGGNVSGDSENFNITVNLRGAPSLPTYMQSHQGTSKIDADGKVEESRKVKKPFGSLESETTAPELRRFGKMFNDLPAFRQTVDIESLKSIARKNHFINFDEAVKKQVQNAVAPNWYSDEAIEIDLQSGTAKKQIEILKEDLFSSERYIRMDLAVEILNKIGSLDRYEIGGKEVTFKIDINNTVIGAFPFIFSTKSDKLAIPGGLPDFFQYFLQNNEIEQLGGGRLLVDDNSLPPRYCRDGLEYFSSKINLNQFGLKEDAGYWGYLKYLFVNFDMFKSKIEQKNKNIREIFLDILNEMSSAVNSFWNFQVVEGEFKENTDVTEGLINTKYNTSKKDGDIIITVIDENFIGQKPNDVQPITFRHVGRDSVFLDANIDISIPSEMTNQIVATRLGNSSNPDETIVAVGNKSFFESKGDLFISNTGTTSAITDTDTDTASEEITTGFASTEEEIASYEAAAEKLFAEAFKIPDDITKLEVKRRLQLFNAADLYKIRAAEAKLRLAQETAKRDTEVVEAQATNLTANLKKLSVVPISDLASLNLNEKDLNEQSKLSNLNLLKSKFVIYTFDDTEFLDKLKREAFSKRRGQTLSHPLPIKYSFKILGNSGIRRGDMFNITGIPEKYSKKGLFQVTQIEHSLEGMQWFTNITGEYRQIQ